MENDKKKNLLKTIGPGLLFASTAIGTSHLVLSTRAGAHHGMIFLAIIIVALVLKYPFYEFGPRYANATGHSLLRGYKKQGKWAIVLFLLVIFISMFAVVGAISAVSAGLLSSIFSIDLPIPILAGCIILLTASLLLMGGYKGLDKFIKLISVVLLITVFIAFVAVLYKGPIEPISEFVAPPLLEGAGLTLLIGLLGWMPAGMEASTMNSVWNVVKIRETGYYPTMKETLFDFKLGYGLTIILALMFVTIGAFTVYGSGQLLGGSATEFSNRLISIFTDNLGKWSYPIMATAAFGTIYGTLIALMDAFPRSFVYGMRVLKFDTVEKNEAQIAYLNKTYKILLIIVGLGSFLLLYFSASSMVKILEMATVISFMISPVIAFLNLRAIQSEDVPQECRPSKGMIYLSYVGLLAMVAFSIYYLSSIF